MSNPVAVGISRLSLLNLSRDETVDEHLVLEVYDGETRVQISFENREHFFEVIDASPADMMEYFENHLFDSPDVDNPRPALERMSQRAAEEGLVTVPPEDDDDRLFQAMTTIFQKTVELAKQHTQPSVNGGDDFLQSLLRDQTS